MQLGLAKDIADHVRQRYPQFQLWKDPQLLRLVLRSMSDDVNRSLFHNMRFMIVDFVCVLLKADSVEDGMQYIRKIALPHLQASGDPVSGFPDAKTASDWEFLKRALVAEWECLLQR